MIDNSRSLSTMDTTDPDNASTSSIAQDLDQLLSVLDTTDVEEQEQQTEHDQDDRAFKLEEYIRPYQLEAAEHMRTQGRAMCTLPPGLGKTEAAIMACLDPYSDPPYSRTDGPVLIVCPSYLTDLWFDRIISWIPTAPVVMASGTRAQRQKVLNYRADWYIINYDMLTPRPAKDINKLTTIPRNEDGTPNVEALAYLKRTNPRMYRTMTSLPAFNLPRPKRIIFDESHHLKNPDGRQARAAHDLCVPPDIDVYMLTGTPIKRDPDDLYMQLHILYPLPNYNRVHPTLVFDDYQDFVTEYCVSFVGSHRTTVMGGRKQKIQRLMDSISYYCSYEDAEIYRPEVEPLQVRFNMDERHAKAYYEIANFYAYQDIKMHSAMEVMHALRTATFCPPKIQAATDLAEQFDSCIFYTYYISSAKMLAESISKALDRPIPVITSEISLDKRGPYVDSLIEKKAPYIVATMGTLSEGKDLSYMKAIVFAEEMWTPAELEQATDRVRRFGNTASKVFVYYLTAKGTIDEHIHAVAMHRGATAEAIVKRVLDKHRKTLLKQGLLVAQDDQGDKDD